MDVYTFTSGVCLCLLLMSALWLTLSHPHIHTGLHRIKKYQWCHIHYILWVPYVQLSVNSLLSRTEAIKILKKSHFNTQKMTRVTIKPFFISLMTYFFVIIQRFLLIITTNYPKSEWLKLFSLYLLLDIMEICVLAAQCDCKKIYALTI